MTARCVHRKPMERGSRRKNLQIRSFLKLRNLQVGYNVPKAWTEKISMERLRFYLSAQNVFTIKSKEFTGVDPENANYGYPIPMNITFGINVGF